jgi:hypothetical protein
VSFVSERADKLKFLQKPVEEAELVALFLKGLHPVFNQLQVYFAVPNALPKTFLGAVTITRRFATNPTVAAELAKLKSNGISQSMFPLTTTTQNQQCRLFASTGLCRFGAQCKFLHAATPATSQSGTPVQSRSNASPATSQSGTPVQEQQSRSKCNFCSKLGHAEEECNLKQKLLAKLQSESQSNSMCKFCELAGHAEEMCPLKQKLLAQFRSDFQTALSTTADIKTQPSADPSWPALDATQFHFVMTTSPLPDAG